MGCGVEANESGERSRERESRLVSGSLNELVHSGQGA